MSAGCCGLCGLFFHSLISISAGSFCILKFISGLLGEVLLQPPGAVQFIPTWI